MEEALSSSFLDGLQTKECTDDVLRTNLSEWQNRHYLDRY